MKRVMSSCRRRWFIIGLLIVLLLIPSAAPFKADSFYGIASPHLFSIARWEAQNLLNKWTYRFTNGIDAERESPSDQVRTVEEYFRLSEKARDTTSRLDRAFAAGQRNDPEVAGLKGELSRVNEQRAQLKAQVEAIIESQIAQVLKEEDITVRLGFPRFEFAFPPVDFELTPLPYVLVISPRQKIDMEDSVLLRAPLPAEQMARLEEKTEKLGYSALVDSIGGVATYPAMITDRESLEFTVHTAAHEWLHHYLFLRPLGRHYADNYNMQTLNETAADIIGGEIGDRVLKLYGIERVSEEKRKEGFSFNREMRQIRLAVDDYLAKGEVEKAEQFMEERRQFLVGQGYLIRKLNQAYFAFHGSYATSPASSSPIAEELQNLRRRYASLAEFTRLVSGVSSYEEFKALLPGT